MTQKKEGEKSSLLKEFRTVTEAQQDLGGRGWLLAYFTWFAYPDFL